MQSAWPGVKVAQLVLTMIAVTLAQPNAMPAEAGQPVELELLLAVDASSSVDRDEFALQMHGLADAFRHPDVQAAIEATGGAGVVVALMQWSDHAQQELAIHWTLLRDKADAARLAETIARTGRLISGGGTAISGAIGSGIEELHRNAFEGRRRVIDISGDGRSSFTLLTEMARDRAVALGMVINGLPILNNDAKLDEYYRDNVIGGTGSFVLAAADYEAFAVAIVAKLIREIARAPIAGMPAGIGTLARR